MTELSDDDACSEIAAIISEYNAVEAEQMARLERLYQLLSCRKGNRRVRFSSTDTWNDCWSPSYLLHPELAHVLFIKPRVDLIVEVETGVPA